MYVLYSLGLTLLFFALLPYFIYQVIRHGKYAGSFKQRIGWLPVAVRSDGRETIWVHAVSVGEFLAARPLIELLKREWPGHRIVVSTTTVTGQELARSRPNSIDAMLYFPFDWNSSVRRALEWVKPSIVIILETELWPNFLRECRRRGVVTILANGRISPRSFSRYRRVHSLIKRTLEHLSLIIMQSEDDAERALQLGAPRGLTKVCGNLKYDQVGVGGWGSGVGSSESGVGAWGVEVGERGPETHQQVSNTQPPTANPQSLTPDPRPPTPNPYAELDRLFQFSASPHLIVAGSTAPGEEEMLLASLREVRLHSGLEDARLLLAPRHPERFDEVARLIGECEFTVARRSDFRSSSSGAQTGERDRTKTAQAVDVILLDTIGELALVYRFAAAVFVGGSLVPRGGHNIIEPAAFARPIIVGHHTENFRHVISDFARGDALVQTDASGLSRELINLLSDRAAARAMGERARTILLRNQGATECTVRAIKEVVS
jgi:3-deoxy-D-manno-octulosonic-acid transferase